MAVKLSPILNDQQFNSNGTLLSGGKIETFLAGSSTPAATFTTDAGDVAQSSPIVLNTRGEVPNPIYLTTGVKYKLALKDSNNNVLRTYDNIEGVNDSSSGIDQWVNTSVAPTFINSTQFTLDGDQTSNFQVNRRFKALITAGTVYGFISTSVFTTLTTITVVLDTGILDSGLSSVQLGLITPNNSSLYSWNRNNQYLVQTVSGLGYGTGAGGSVTQLTSKATAVTLNRPSGSITTNNSSLASNASSNFLLNNTLITTTDVVVCNVAGNAGNHRAEVINTALSGGGVTFRITNISAGALGDAVVIAFTVIKGAAS